MKTIAILYPGDMGSALAKIFQLHSFKCVSCLARRSARTKKLAENAGVIEVPESELAHVDAVLSILHPNKAFETAERLSKVMRRGFYIDANAVSPQTTNKMANMFNQPSGATFIDAGIIGGPPQLVDGEYTRPTFVISGQVDKLLQDIPDFGKAMKLRRVGDEIGNASALKMSYASMTKGAYALGLQSFTSAALHHVLEDLRELLSSSAPQHAKFTEGGIVGCAPKAGRWVGEMEEIAETFGEDLFTPDVYNGIAQVYQTVHNSVLGQETPEHRVRGKTVEDVIAGLHER